jgi:hypothetical protein
MTVTSSATYTSELATNGSTVDFPFGFPIDSSADLAVILTTISTGDETELAEGDDFTVTYTLFAQAGTVTTVATYDTGYTIRIERRTAATQEADLASTGGFKQETFQKLFDKATMVIQQQQALLDRMLAVPRGEALPIASRTFPSVADRAGKLAAFDDDGYPTAIPVSASGGGGGSSTGVYNVDDYGLVGDDTTDCTPFWDILVALVPTGSTLRFSPGQTYYFATHPYRLTKALVIDGNGASIRADITPDTSVNGKPLFSFVGTKTLPYTLDATTQGDTEVVCATIGDASNFAVDDMVLLYSTDAVPVWDDSGTSDVELQEVNRVTAVDTGTGTITLAYPVKDSCTAVTISRIDAIHGATVKNFANITEVYAGGANDDTDQFGPDVPNIVDFLYCVDPRVENVTVDGFGKIAISFAYCESPSAFRVHARNAYHPDQGGLGSCVKSITCRSGSVEHCRGYNIRQMVDWVGCIACGSAWNECVLAPGATGSAAYLVHGFRSKGITSLNDTAINCRGWSVGNEGFSYDEQITITNFRMLQTSEAVHSGIVVWNGAIKVQITNPDIESNGNSIHLFGACSHVLVRGGIVRCRSNTHTPILIDDDNSLYPGNVHIDGVDIFGITSGIVTNCGNLCHLSNNLITANTGIQCSDGSPAADLWVLDNVVTRIADSEEYGIGVCANTDNLPTNSYRVEGNTVKNASGYAGLKLRTSALMVVKGNRCPGLTTPIQLVGSTTVAQVRAGGGVIIDNGDLGTSIETGHSVWADYDEVAGYFWRGQAGYPVWGMARNTSANDYALGLAAYDPSDGSYIDTPLSFGGWQYNSLIIFGSSGNRPFAFGTGSRLGTEQYRFAGAGAPSVNPGTNDVLIGAGQVWAGKGIGLLSGASTPATQAGLATIWYDGTNWKGKTPGGTVVTFTVT